MEWNGLEKTGMNETIYILFTTIALDGTVTGKNLLPRRFPLPVHSIPFHLKSIPCFKLCHP